MENPTRTLFNALTYLQFQRDPRDFPFWKTQPLEQAQDLLRGCLDQLGRER